VRGENFLLVAITAERFACRPSRLVGLHDPVLALDFDLAAAARLLEHQRVASSVGLQADTCPPEGGRYGDSAYVRDEHW